ncbi:DUF1704 domain-containing protein [Candidatus Dojkabacteria bacterium]|nr:DUF1704 domain-containing protein [Candidatus Dojkabacteria bacterium]
MQEVIQPEKLDQDWFTLYEEYRPNEPYDYFFGEKEKREQQKQKFLAGEVRNPTFDYPRLSIPQLIQTEENLLALKKALIDAEENEIVKEAYRWKLNSEIMSVRLIMASATGDMEMFKKYTEAVYGEPSMDIFAHFVNRIRTELNQDEETANEELAEAIHNLKSVLPEELPKAKIITLPSEEVVKKAQKQTLDEMQKLIELTRDKKYYSPVDIQKEFRRAIETLNADKWDVVIDDETNRTALAVSSKDEKVYVPANRATVHDELQELILHEIGTHVKRRVEGERSKLMLLGSGLDRHEKGGEGVATMREQALRGKVKSFAGEELHFAISLAYGLDGNPRDFRDVFEVMTKLYEYKFIKNGINKKLAKIAAEDNAWKTCTRVFRGTDCKTPGTAFTKDIIYAKGNIDIWNVIQTNPDEMMRFSIGKYDPANPRHVWLLDQLGINEQDLKDMKPRL